MMGASTQSKRDVWIEAGVVWAAAEGTLPDAAHRNLAQRAVTMAASAGPVSWRLLLDYRRASLTADAPSLSRLAEQLSGLGLPAGTRIAMLCQQRSANFAFWERVLRARGHEVSVFTDAEAALSWLHRPNVEEVATAGSAETAVHRILKV